MHASRLAFAARPGNPRESPIVSGRSGPDLRNNHVTASGDVGQAVAGPEVGAPPAALHLGARRGIQASANSPVSKLPSDRINPH